MCRICGSYPCHPSCPNTPEPMPVYNCSECGSGIYAGERYVDLFRGPVCENCLDDYLTEDWLELFGEELVVAKDEMD